jgi:polyhydroxybutyrate depolymerase
MTRRTLRRVGLGLGLLVVILGAAHLRFLHTRIPHEPTLTAHVRHGNIRVGDLERSYLFYVPEGLPKGAPLLIVFHGSGETGAGMRVSTGYEFDRLADAHHFAVIYPDGYEKNWDDCRIAAHYPARTLHIDDVGLTLSLISRFHADYGIDTNRVFATGYSNGGHMAIRLGLEQPDRVTAIAAIAASVPTEDNSDCHETHKPVPALFLNGTKDPLSPYDGGHVTIFGFGDRGTVRSSFDSAAFFAQLDGLTDPPALLRLPHRDAEDPTSVERTMWGGGAKPEVILDTVVGGGHVVPQPVFRAPRILGRTTGDLNGPEEIWSFFARQRPLGPQRYGTPADKPTSPLFGLHAR